MYPSPTRIAWWLVLAVVAAAALAAPAAAVNPTVPLLTGGELTSDGTGSATWQATTAPPGGPCGDKPDSAFDETAQVTWKTSFLTSIGYEATPLLPTNDYTQGDSDQQAAAEQWDSAPGSGHSEIQQNHVDHDTCVSEDRVCDETLSAQRPSILATWFLFSPQIVTPIEGLWQDQGCTGGDPTGTIPGAFLAADTMDSWQAPPQPRLAESMSITRDEDGDEANLKALCENGGWTTCSQHVSLHDTVTLHCVLCVRNIRFEEPIDPDEPDGARTDVPAKGAYDGNRIHIVVTVYNTLGRTLTSPVRLYEAKTHRFLLPIDGPYPQQPVTFKPGANQLELDWNSTGFAWESGKPFPEREIEVVTALGGAEKALRIVPKPVVLVHGWNSNASTWDTFKGFLEDENPDWRGYAVGDGQAPGVMHTDMRSGDDIFVNARAEADYVSGLRLKLHAAHVDLVAHSMGGLISRAYIDAYMKLMPDGTPPVSHLVMLGTPNRGSPCAEPASTLFAALGYSAIPTWQLRPDFLELFNTVVTNQKGVPFSVLAGDAGIRTCGSPVKGDGVVAVPDAWWKYTDTGRINLIHTHLITNPSVVTAWVRPHLGVGPLFRAARRMTAASAKHTPKPSPTIAVARKAKLQPGARLEVPVKVSGGAALDALASAPPGVSIALVDPKGKAAVTQHAGAAAASEPVRFVSVAHPDHGHWSIVLEDRSAHAAQVEVAGSVPGAPLALAAHATRDAKGHVTVTATVRRHGHPFDGEKLTAVVVDGTHRLPVALESLGDGRWRGRSGAVHSTAALALVKASGHAGSAETSAVTGG